MRPFAALLVSSALSLAGWVTAPAAAQPRATEVVGVTAGQDRAQLEVRDGSVVLSGERSWPLGLRAPADGEISETTWRRMAAGALVRMGAPAEVADSYAMGDGPVMHATQPAGDLDGDGRRDVLVTGWHFSPDGGSLQVRALRGQDGEELWSQEYAGFAFATPGKVGPDGKDGVVVAASGWSNVGMYFAGAQEATTRVEWLSGADGAAVASREFKGHAVQTGAGTVVRGMPTNIELLDTTGSGVTDALVTQLDLLVAPGVWRATATATVVAGTDGATVATAQEDDDSYREPIAFAAGDLDGQAGDDIVFVVADHDWDGAAGRMSAHSSVDAAPLWEREDLLVDPWVFVGRPGDMTGDGREELLVSSFTGHTSVLDGATGETRWSRAAQVAYPAGDTDRDGRTEVGVMHMGYGSHRTHLHAHVVGGPPPNDPIPIIGGGMLVGFAEEVSSSPIPAGRIGIVTRVIDGEGGVLRTDRVLVQRPKGDHSSRLEFQRIGDVDGDRVPDAFAAAVVADMDRETFASDRRLISGRSGATAWRPPLRTRAAGGAVDGAGDDIVAKHGRGLQVRDGQTGRLLWGVAGKLAPGGSGFQAADLTGDGRAELLISSSRGTIALDGRTGTVRWKVAPPPLDMTW